MANTDYYGEPGPFTTILGSDLPTTPEECLKYVRRLLEPASITLLGNARRRSACDLRQAQQILNLGLSCQQAVPAQRALGDSRTYGVLFVALLRMAHHPARLRSVFVDYFERNRWTARWLVELLTSGAWQVVDPQLDDSLHEKIVHEVDADNVDRRHVRLAAQAWQYSRTGQENAREYGIASHRGFGVLRESLYRDVCALNRLELLSADHFFGFRDKSSTTAAECELLDSLAELSADVGTHPGALMDLFLATPELDRSVRFRLNLAPADNAWPSSAQVLLDKVFSGSLAISPSVEVEQTSDDVPPDVIRVEGATQNNLKNIDVNIRHKTFTVVTGLSGCGKSSLAFDTVYAASQRRFVESLSPFARRYIDQIKPPKVQRIRNLIPAVSIEQRTVSRNPRSTVGTITRISPLIRLLFSRAGRRSCVRCGHIVQPISPGLLANCLKGSGIKFTSLEAPIDNANSAAIFRVLLRASHLKHAKAIDGDGRPISLDYDALSQARDPRIQINDGRSISTELVRTAFDIGDGVLMVKTAEGEARFSDRPICPACRLASPELTSQSFTTNSPISTCSACGGAGTKMSVDPEKIVVHPERSILDGALSWFTALRSGKQTSWPVGKLELIAEYFGDDLESPWQAMSEGFRRTILYGLSESDRKGRRQPPPKVNGLIPEIERLYGSSSTNAAHMKYAAYMSESPCPVCRGTGLRQEALAVDLGGLNIEQIQQMPLESLHEWIGTLIASDHQMGAIIRPIAQEIRSRLRHVLDVGLPYLCLSRGAPTLSGGEAQRLKIARQLGIGLTGILYVLDEPSIGLHARDQSRLIGALRKLQMAGNTVLVVEHDEATMRAADEIIDMGWGAGGNGGQVIAQGTPEEISRNPHSVTGPYLIGTRSVLDEVPGHLPIGKSAPKLRLLGARLHNLRDVQLEIPLGRMTVVTGVSGSGKSSLILSTLAPALKAMVAEGRAVGPFDELQLDQPVHNVLEVDQSPIGRTPRSCPATYLGIMDDLRSLFASTSAARKAQLGPASFSFNSAAGHCPHCKGLGSIRVEMHFLPDVWTDCPECVGQRYNDRVLSIRWNDLTIADVLNLGIAEATRLFATISPIRSKLEIVERVGLGYLSLGQNAVTLSGGEAQRIKLSRELMSKRGDRRFYILDEPTTGLHFADINRLLKVFRDLVASGHTVVVIEHNLDVVRASDWIVDLGPEGGDRGGHIVYQGTVAGLSRDGASHTGRWLALSKGKKECKRIDSLC